MADATRDRIAWCVRTLPANRLTLAYDFILFLASGSGTGLESTPTEAAPTEATPTKAPPTKAGPTQDSREESTPTEPSESYFSFAWLMRVLFGDPDFPADETLPRRPPYKRLMETPLHGQEQSQWCWAATAQMIMTHHGRPVTQTELARDVGNRSGWPPFDSRWGFTSEERTGETLRPDEIEAEIDAGRPFAISWRYSARTGHMLVIAGYLWVGEQLWLVAHDPWPPGSGDRSLLSYQHYQRGFAGALTTVYNIRRTSISPRARS